MPASNVSSFEIVLVESSCVIINEGDLCLGWQLNKLMRKQLSLMVHKVGHVVVAFALGVDYVNSELILLIQADHLMLGELNH